MSREQELQAFGGVVVTLVRILLIFTVSLAVVSCGYGRATVSPAGQYPADQALVDEIVDGDTIVVQFANGTVERVRLLGIDTPETSDPTRPLQCFGTEATSRLTSLISPGTEVRLERDLEARDQYGRLLAYVFRVHDDLFVNRVLVQEGFADISFYEPNVAYREVLTHAVTEARTGEIGLWLSCGGPDVAIDPDT